MSLVDEKKGVRGPGLHLTIERPSPAGRRMDRTDDDVESTSPVTPISSRRPHDQSSPYSPFYDHSDAPATLSLQETNTPKKSHLTVYESDIEACLTETKSSMLSKKKTTNQCTVWPGQKALMDAKRVERRRGECWNPMRGLDKRTKLWLKVLIAALIVGIAVAVGLGISKAVGGGIWKQDNASN